MLLVIWIEKITSLIFEKSWLILKYYELVAINFLYSSFVHCLIHLKDLIHSRDEIITFIAFKTLLPIVTFEQNSINSERGIL